MTGICKAQNPAPSGREYWLDMARVVAILSVTINHALHRSFHVLSATQEEFLLMSAPASLLKALLYVFSRVGVPLFLMISGALLIPRNYEDTAVRKRFIRHNWWKLLRTTLIWLLLYFCFLQVFSGSVLRTKGFLSALVHCVSTMLFLNQTTTGNMWYMPMILCIYLMIPVISVALKKLGNRYFLALSVIVLVSGFIIPNINSALSAAGSGLYFDWSVNKSYLFSIYLLYVCVGYWISRGKLSGVCNTALWIVFFVCAVVSALFQYWIYSTPDDYWLYYDDIGIFFVSVSLFELIRRKAVSGSRLKQPVTYLSKISFGVFFVHICIMEVLNKFLNIAAPSLIRYPKFIILETVCFVSSVLIILVTSKIRFFADYLYLIKE